MVYTVRNFTQAHAKDLFQTRRRVAVSDFLPLVVKREVKGEVKGDVNADLHVDGKSEVRSELPKSKAKSSQLEPLL